MRPKSFVMLSVCALCSVLYIVQTHTMRADCSVDLQYMEISKTRWISNCLTNLCWDFGKTNSVKFWIQSVSWTAESLTSMRRHQHGKKNKKKLKTKSTLVDNYIRLCSPVWALSYTVAYLRIMKRYLPPVSNVECIFSSLVFSHCGYFDRHSACLPGWNLWSDLLTNTFAEVCVAQTPTHYCFIPMVYIAYSLVFQLYFHVQANM